MLVALSFCSTITLLDACRQDCTDLDLVLRRTASLRQCQHQTLQRSNVCVCVWALAARHSEACMVVLVLLAYTIRVHTLA